MSAFEECPMNSRLKPKEDKIMAAEVFDYMMAKCFMCGMVKPCRLLGTQMTCDTCNGLQQTGEMGYLNTDVHDPDYDGTDLDGLDLEIWEHTHSSLRLELALALLALICGVIIALLGIVMASNGWSVGGLFLQCVGAACAIAGAVTWARRRKG